MAKYVVGAFAALGLIMFTIFTFSTQYISVADSDNETSVENATRNATSVFT